MAVGPFAVLRFDLAFHLLGAAPVGRFLDIGCGAGDFTLELARRGASGVAIDRSSAAVATTSRRLAEAGVTTVEVALGDVSVARGPFDTAFAFEVVEHIEDDVAFLESVRQVLRPGGRLVVSTPAHARLWDATDTISGHVRRYERDDLAGAFERAGFTDVRVASLGVPLANIGKPRLAARNRALLEASGLEHASLEERTAESGLHRALPLSDRAYRLAFNRVTLAPAIALQRAFARSALGVNWVAVGRVPD